MTKLEKAEEFFSTTSMTNRQKAIYLIADGLYEDAQYYIDLLNLNSYLPTSYSTEIEFTKHDPSSKFRENYPFFFVDGMADEQITKRAKKAMGEKAKKIFGLRVVPADMLNKIEIDFEDYEVSSDWYQTEDGKHDWFDIDGWADILKIYDNYNEYARNQGY